MERWMKILTCAGYEYMKLMVADLQRQLEELDKSKGNQCWEIGHFLHFPKRILRKSRVFCDSCQFPKKFRENRRITNFCVSPNFTLFFPPNFSDASTNSIPSEAPKPPPRRQNPFNRPAPPPPSYATAKPTQGKILYFRKLYLKMKY